MAVPDPDRPSLAASVPASARRRVLIWLACAAAMAVFMLVAGALAPTAGAASRKSPSTRGGWWAPHPGDTWQWQLTGRLNTSVAADVYDVDLFDTSKATVAALHHSDRYVVCYLDAGTYENWRPDRWRFPRSVLGARNGWPGERWLDIRRLSALEPIMRARMALCARKRFDAVEADNVDGYTNHTGFPLTAAQQLTYNRWLARTAHGDHLGIALKNDLDQVRALQPDFDFALDEQCFQYAECGLERPFVRAGKAVYEVEYNLAAARFCARARADGFEAMRKHLDLDAWRQPCS
jgi:hypothetical protein